MSAHRLVAVGCTSNRTEFISVTVTAASNKAGATTVLVKTGLKTGILMALMLTLLTGGLMLPHRQTS